MPHQISNLLTEVAHLKRLLNCKYSRMHHEMCCALAPVNCGEPWETVFKSADDYIAKVKQTDQEVENA